MSTIRRASADEQVCFHEKFITIGYCRAHTPAVTLL
jgi:hypothetical protein